MQRLRVEQDDTEQTRVLEYLAIAEWAASAVAQAANSHPKAVDLRVPLNGIAKALQAQIGLILGTVTKDRQCFGELRAKLDERFADRLGSAKTQPSAHLKLA